MIHIAFDGLSGVDGSARFSFGQTTAIASVSGPITARLAAEHPVRATIDIHVRPLTAISRTAEKHTASTLKGILERVCILAQHPRTSIQVVVQALSSSGDSHLGTDVRLAAQINATSLALLNAGSVPMRGVVCAVAVAVPAPTSQPQLVTDLDTGAEYSGCFAFLFGVDKLVEEIEIHPSKMIWTNYHARPGSAFSLEALGDAEKVALEGAKAVWIEMKDSLNTS